MPCSHARRFAVWMLAVSPAFSLWSCADNSSVAKEDAPQKPVTVKTVAVAEEKVQPKTTQPATVHAYYRAEIRAKSHGYVKSVKVDIGDFVTENAPLAVIDVPEMTQQRLVIDARISRYQAEERRAAAGVTLATAGVKSAEAKLAQAKSAMSAADASLAAMEAEFVRTQDLVSRQSLESRMLDEVRKKRDSAQAEKEAVASAILSAEADVTVAKAKRTAAEADVEAAKAATEVARRERDELDVLMNFATLKAPFDGIITQRNIDPGDLVREGSEVGDGEPLFVISQVKTVRIHVAIPEAEAALINRGDVVTLEFPSFPAEETLSATVTRPAGELDPSTRTMLVEIEVPNEDRKLLPGMFGQATISLSGEITANMLPARAIRFNENGDAYVYAISNEDTVTVTPVTTGIDNGNRIEVKSGVDAGQVVIDAHLKRFTTGQKVSLLK